MPPWKPLLPLTTAAVRHTNHRSPDTDPIGCGHLRAPPPPPIVVREHVGTCSPSGGVWCRRPRAPGRNGNPCSRLSAQMFIYERERGSVSQRDQQARAFLAGPEKISSVAFLLAWRRETPIPQQQELHSWRPWLSAGNAPIPPSLHPSLFSFLILLLLSILAAPRSPCCPPSLNSKWDSTAERSQVPHMELLLWSRSVCHHWHQFRGGIHTGTSLRCCTSSICEAHSRSYL